MLFLHDTTGTNAKPLAASGKHWVLGRKGLVSAAWHKGESPQMAPSTGQGGGNAVEICTCTIISSFILLSTSGIVSPAGEVSQLFPRIRGQRDRESHDLIPSPFFSRWEQSSMHDFKSSESDYDGEEKFHTSLFGCTLQAHKAICKRQPRSLTWSYKLPQWVLFFKKKKKKSYTSSRIC